MKRKKYLFLIPRMGNGGAERVMATLANELVKSDNDVLILSLTSDESFYDLDKKVKIIGAGFKVSKERFLVRQLQMLFNVPKSFNYLEKTISKYQPDIVVSFLTHTNILAILMKVFNPKIKLVVSERCEPWERSIPIKLATKYLYPLANTIVCQSKVVSSFFPRKAQRKIKIIENPINIESTSNEVASIRKKNIVGVGRLFEQKNFSLLIDAFNDIKDEFPKHTLQIYGDGPQKEELEHKIKALNLTDQVYLMGVKSNVMKEVYDSALFVMSSNYEGFPNALIEAMASGLPVISTDFSTGVARDLVKQENGIIVPVKDRSALSNAMRKILSDNDFQIKAGYENRKIIDKLSPKVIMDKWQFLFDNL